MQSLMSFLKRNREPLKRGEREAQSLKRRRQKDIFVRGLSAAAVAMVVIVSVYLWQSGIVSEAVRDTGERVEERLTDAGLVVAEIRIDGQKQTALDDIRKALGVQHGENIMSLDLKSMRERVEALDWVERASIGRSMPDILTVGITEHEPAALWQIEGHLWLVTRDGRRITDQKLAHFAGLPMVVGRGADMSLAGYLEMGEAWPEIFDNVESAVRVGARRWDLLMKQGVTVRLPEKNVPAALEKLAGLQRDEKILEKEILAVDLRLEDKTFIRLTPGEAERRRRLAAENAEEEQI
ncbi:cell division protein FtsQ/DivIB [Emcibacter sp.]|uniref:cell division protein FtsQ/DivIB n=1 Tax=Emcibacter sp. TaxID=1979954 RepID=UPI003A8DD23C